MDQDLQAHLIVVTMGQPPPSAIHPGIMRGLYFISTS
jgi:hypothetical protein